MAGAGGWIKLAQGVEKKELWSDGKFASCFFRLAAGSRLEGHLHPADEECLMLAGELLLGDVLLRAGDYQLAPSGSRHGATLAFAFGLVHGFGFAGALAESLRSTPAGESWLLDLAAFNLGIEAFQLTLILTLLPLIRKAARFS